jgi:hypothetical protein
MILHWKWKSDAYLRYYVTDANGSPVAGATGTVAITFGTASVSRVTAPPEPGAAIGSGNISADPTAGAGYYRFSLDPAWNVEHGDNLIAESDITGDGKKKRSKLLIFVGVDDD